MLADETVSLSFMLVGLQTQPGEVVEFVKRFEAFKGNEEFFEHSHPWDLLKIQIEV